MRLQKTLGTTFGALALAAVFATAAPAGATDWVRCHDETTMYIGQLVDGKCLSPYAPLGAPATQPSGHETDSAPTSAERGDDVNAVGGAQTSAS